MKIHCANTEICVCIKRLENRLELTFNHGVPGSTPGGLTNKNKGFSLIFGAAIFLKGPLGSTPAWRAPSDGARSPYMALRERYKPKLQNSVYFAGRAAVKELGSHSASDWSCRRSSSARNLVNSMIWKQRESWSFLAVNSKAAGPE
jgi:hypothetical protein